MDPDVDTLQTAIGEWGARLRQVRADQWALSTPCTEWTVRQLANHVVAGAEMSVRLLDGAEAADVAPLFAGDRLGAQPVATWERTSSAEVAAFSAPDVSERTVHHPGAGDISGATLCGFRITDNLVHAWDLARAIGDDEALDPGAVAAVWSVVEPMAGMIPAIGIFGTGPSGAVGADAPLEIRLLDLTGRRP